MFNFYVQNIHFFVRNNNLNIFVTMLQFLPVLYGKQKTAVSVGVRFKPPLHMFFSLFIRFKPVNGLSEVGEAFFIFRYYISLKIAVMQIKRNVLYCKAVF